MLLVCTIRQIFCEIFIFTPIALHSTRKLKWMRIFQKSTRAHAQMLFCGAEDKIHYHILDYEWELPSFQGNFLSTGGGEKHE